MNRISFFDKNPIRSSIIATFLFLLVITAGGIISGITGISSKITLFVAFSILALILIVFVSKMDRWHYYGFKSMNQMRTSAKIK